MANKVYESELQGRFQQPKGQYYLHTNGKIIYKPNGDVDAMSDFVLRVWPASLPQGSPEGFIQMIREAHQMGASEEYLTEMAEQQNLGHWISDWRERAFKPEKQED